MGGNVQINQNTQAGFTLVEALVSMALVGIVLYITQKLLLSNLEFSKHTSDRYDLIQIAHDIERRIDCSKAPTVCPMASPFPKDLVDQTGGELIKIDKTSKFRGWTVAAECGPQDTIVVRGAQPLPYGGFIKDPVTKMARDWANNKNIIFAPGILCSTKLKEAAAPVDLDLGIIAGPACVVTVREKLPCPAPDPPDCKAGYYTSGIALDTFGGYDTGGHESEVFGQRKVRYCIKSPPAESLAP